MVIGVTLVLTGAVIIAVLLLVRLKKFKHGVFALLLIALILFGVFSSSLAFKEKNITISDVLDLGKVAKIYVSWLGTAFQNVQVITTQAIKMDWQGNQTA